MTNQRELLEELIFMADMEGNGVSVRTDIGVIATRCGFTVGRTRRLLNALERKRKIRISWCGMTSILGGYEKLHIHLLV